MKLCNGPGEAGDSPDSKKPGYKFLYHQLSQMYCMNIRNSKLVK